MGDVNTWQLVEQKAAELRRLTDVSWTHSQWELAALGESVLRTVERSRIESERLRTTAVQLDESIETLVKTAFVTGHGATD